MSSQGPATTETTSLPGYVSNYAQSLLGAAGNAAQMPYVPYTGPRVADLSPTQNLALSGFTSALPAIGNAATTLEGLISGDTANPILDSLNRGVIQNYNNAVSQTTGRFNTPGNFGSARNAMADSLNQQALATGLGDADAQFRLGAMSQLGGLVNTGLSGLNSALNAGGVQQSQLQNVYNTAYNDFLEQRNYPWQQLQNAAGILGIGMGGSPRTTTTQQGYDPVSQGLGLYQLGSQKGGGNTSLGSKGGSPTVSTFGTQFSGDDFG